MIRRILIAAATTASALSFPPAGAAPTVVASATAFRYLPGDVSLPDAPLQVAQGTLLEFAPADPLGNHTITSLEYREGAPLFSSELVGPGQVSAVAGVEALPVGVYPFGCTVHEYMFGTLEIVAVP